MKKYVDTIHVGDSGRLFPKATKPLPPTFEELIEEIRQKKEKRICPYCDREMESEVL